MTIVDILDLSTSSVSEAIRGKRNYTSFALQLTWTGDPTGSFSVETSADKITWDTLEIKAADAEGSANSHTFHINIITAVEYRIRYTRISGTGSCSINQVGALNGYS